MLVALDFLDVIPGGAIGDIKSLGDLVDRDVLITDGLTTVAKSGRVLECGQIIRVKENLSAHWQRAGGGRTQAALAASRYGLVIKISEDGPISFFEDGREQIRIVL